MFFLIALFILLLLVFIALPDDVQLVLNEAFVLVHRKNEFVFLDEDSVLRGVGFDCLLEPPLDEDVLLQTLLIFAQGLGEILSQGVLSLDLPAEIHVDLLVMESEVGLFADYFLCAVLYGGLHLPELMLNIVVFGEIIESPLQVFLALLFPIEENHWSLAVVLQFEFSYLHRLFRLVKLFPRSLNPQFQSQMNGEKSSPLPIPQLVHPLLQSPPFLELQLKFGLGLVLRLNQLFELILQFS